MSVKEIAFDSAYYAALGGLTGYALGGNPATFAAASGLTQLAGWIAPPLLVQIPHIKEREYESLLFFLHYGVRQAVPAALLYKLGLTKPAQGLLALTALAATTIARMQPSQNVNDPHSKVTYTVYAHPAALVYGASFKVLQACAFGWNPVALGTIGAVNSLLHNSSYAIFGCIDRRNHQLGCFARDLSAIALGASLFHKNMQGVAASIAFIGVSALATRYSLKQ